MRGRMTEDGSYKVTTRERRLGSVPRVPSVFSLPSFFLSSVLRQRIDQPVQLLLGEVDLLRRGFDVEQAGAHGDGDLVEIANLGEDLVGVLAQAEEAALLGEGAAVALDQLLRREALGEGDDFLARAAGQRASVGEAEVVPGLVGEPEPADVLDAVVQDAHRDVVATA